MFCFGLVICELAGSMFLVDRLSASLWEIRRLALFVCMSFAPLPWNSYAPRVGGMFTATHTHLTQFMQSTYRDTSLLKKDRLCRQIACAARSSVDGFKGCRSITLLSQGAFSLILIFLLVLKGVFRMNFWYRLCRRKNDLRSCFRNSFVGLFRAWGRSRYIWCTCSMIVLWEVADVCLFPSFLLLV